MRYNLSEMAPHYAYYAGEAQQKLQQLAPFQRIDNGMYMPARLWHMETRREKGLVIGARISIRAAMGLVGREEDITLADLYLNIHRGGTLDVKKSMRLSQGQSVIEIRDENGNRTATTGSGPDALYGFVRKPEDFDDFFGRLIADAEWVADLTENVAETRVLSSRR